MILPADADRDIFRGIHDTTRLVCAWCKKEIWAGTEPAAHSICSACAQIVGIPSPVALKKGRT